ncbi:hypothetical protein SAY87_004050 [Trapa incisa]|uniref:Uncharacterized protein n=2 Tax=Trapa TaxID=22665 RepID=A0AAN7L3C3_TRANT|nr:hypothetical protein SAY87_004050 [Trapa incisa]KAK4781498.1 hypothetical protein SAY86_015600 [Trapa natans]
MAEMFAIISVAHGGVDDKCAAGELEISISNEKPRNHLDMRQADYRQRINLYAFHSTYYCLGF